MLIKETKIIEIEKKKHIMTLWILYFYCALHTTIFYTVVQRFMCAVFCCSISLLHTYLNLLLQYSLMRKIQKCTLLCILCTRLVHNLFHLNWKPQNSHKIISAFILTDIQSGNNKQNWRTTLVCKILFHKILLHPVRYLQ